MAKSILGEFKKQDIKKMAFKNQIENIHYKKIKPAKKNRALRRIEELAEDIKADGLEENLVLRKIENAEYDYELVAGHRRYSAICLNIENGDKTYEYIPCKIQNYDELTARKRLILNNYHNDPLTTAEKLDAVEELKEILIEERKINPNGVHGRLQSIIANELGMKKSQVGNYEKIINNAIPEVREKIVEGDLTIKAAAELSSLDKEKQRSFINNKQDLDIKSIKKYKEKVEEIVPPGGTSCKNTIEECMKTLETTLCSLNEKISGVEWKEEQIYLEKLNSSFKEFKQILNL